MRVCLTAQTGRSTCSQTQVVSQVPILRTKGLHSPTHRSSTFRLARKRTPRSSMMRDPSTANSSLLLATASPFSLYPPDPFFSLVPAMVLNHFTKQNRLTEVAENYSRDNPFNSNSRVSACLKLIQTTSYIHSRSVFHQEASILMALGTSRSLFCCLLVPS